MTTFALNCLFFCYLNCIFVYFFVSFSRKRKLGLAGTAARVALPSDPIFLSKLQRTNDKGGKKNKFDYLAQFSIGRKNTSTPRPGQGCVNVKRHNYAPTSVKLMTLKQHQMCPLNATQVDPSNDTPSDSQFTPPPPPT